MARKRNMRNYRGDALNVKLKNEKQKKSTKLKKENEEMLNMLGVYDEEINSLSDEILDDIDDEELVGVSTSYFILFGRKIQGNESNQCYMHFKLVAESS